MKKCGWCSRLHDDDAVVCECGTARPFAWGRDSISASIARDYARLVTPSAWVPGNDISKWQDIGSTPAFNDFNKMASLSKFCVIKRTQGAWSDRDGDRNASESLGKIRRGWYVYLDWSRSLVDQVDYMLGVIDGDLGELPITLDYECWENAPTPGAARLQLRAAIERLTYLMRVAGWNVDEKKPLLYTSPGYWATFGSADLWWMLNADLWIAHYYTSQPSVPYPWIVARLWQYSDKGDGIAHGVESKQIDMDWYTGDVDSFERWALPLPGSPPPPPPPDPEPGVWPVNNKSKCVASWQYLRSNHVVSSSTLISDGRGDYEKVRNGEVCSVVDIFNGDRYTNGDNWLQVKRADGTLGWVASYYRGVLYQVTTQ